MLTLTYPWFLSGLVFLGVPVILHLMNREVPRRLVFPSIRFIRRAKLPREGRRRLRDILLLLMRLAALAAAIFAFARPLWHRETEAGVAGPVTGRRTVVVLDASASMSAGNTWEDARVLTRRVIDEATGPVGLIISTHGAPVSFPPGTDSGELMAAVDAARPEPVAGDHSQALAEAARMLANDTDGQVVIISDLQLGDWQASRSALPAETDLRLRRPDSGPVQNVGITDVSVSDLGAGRSRVVVQVRSFATIPQQRSLTVRVGQAARTNTVSVPPLQVRNLAVAIEHGPDAKGVARLTGDDYALDDTFHFWAGGTPPVSMLAVSPEPDSDNDQSAQVFFLKKGLETTAPGQTMFRLDTVPVDAFFALDLDQVPILFFLGTIETLDEAGFEQLRNFLAAGGTAVCTPGRMPNHMLHSLHVNDLFRGRFLEVAGRQRRRGEAFGIGWVNPEGLLGQVFSHPEQTDLFLFPIRQYIRFEPPDEAVIHLRTLREDPLLAEATVGRGRIFLSAIPFDTEWSDLPLTASFLPIVRRIAQASIPSGHGILRIACGDAIPVQTDLLGEADIPDNVDAVTRSPGVLVWGDTPVQINVARRESSTETVNAYDLTRQLTTGRAPRQPQTTPRTTQTTVSLWPYLAAAAAGILLVEMIVTGWTDSREIRGRLPAAST